MRRTMAGALALAAVLTSHLAGASALTPLPERLSDQTVLRDQARFDSLAMRLAVFDTVSVPRSAYAQAKAKAWLELARETYALNDRSGLCETAYDQAVSLASELETRSVDLQAPSRVIPGTAYVHPELWQFADSLKRTDALRCVAGDLGRFEVTLVRAGHEAHLCRASEPHPYAAEAMKRSAEIRRRADECVAPVVAAPVTAPLPGAAPATPPEHVEAALRRLGALSNVHFDRNTESISAASAAVLDSVADVMKAVPEIHASLIGHTDPRGSAAYNLALGQRRAQSVLSFLTAAGVDPSRLTIGSQGKAAPVAIGQDVHDYALNRRVEILYSAPGGVQIEAHHQERDLQLEKQIKRRVLHGLRKSVPKPATTPH
jgi:outer membrane protein OmpA-like peptidoglycan-associated protein